MDNKLDTGNKSLTVAPFECAWRQDLRFREAGRGCIAFDAFAHNDVTVVFRENVGSQHYHYKMDNSPHYTVILGSHRNRRFKIEVDGNTVVDVEDAGLCCSSAFQSYWISIYDGLICVGKGRYPFQNLVFQWLDSNPNCNVRYVGLSSWDKHVGYRNINVLPLTQNHLLLWKQVGLGEHSVEEDGEEAENDLSSYQNYCGLQLFLENSDLSDVLFMVGEEGKLVPAHKLILQASGSFPFSSSSQDIVELQEVSYPILQAFLQYVYTGYTQVSESQLVPLMSLSLKFEVWPLVKQCEEAINRFKLNKKLFESGKNVELSYLSIRPHSAVSFPSGLPVNAQKLQKLYLASEYSDLNIYVEGHGLVANCHKLMLSLYSAPFAKMFTNGMAESNSSDVCIRDVSPEALKAMLDFMYSGELYAEDAGDKFGYLLLQLLVLADKFGITLLHQECCKVLLECLSEDSVCAILQAVSSIQSCKLIQETCERKFSMHFDYCATASLNFVYLDDELFKNILKHPDLTVTSEERVVDAILMWGVKAKEVCNWEVIDGLVIRSTPEFVFQERLQSVHEYLTLVRFPLLPYGLLKRMESSSLTRQLPVFGNLVKEAIKYVEIGPAQPTNEQNFRCQHRKSSFKELQYICDGDSNGVLYFAGTSYGQHQWVNPGLAKRITITASSPASRFTDPKVLVSRSYQGTCYAGPRLEGGQTCAWWMVDLGENHQSVDMLNEFMQLMCNYYTLRQDGSTAFARFWKFQGSMDGVNWINLRVHENDGMLCKAGQFGSWPVCGPNSLLPFRFFRVALTGPTTDASNPWNLCICFLELYGFFL